MVAGYRLNRADRLHRRLMAGCWNLLARLLFHIPVRDVNCAFKLFDRRVLEAVEIDAELARMRARLSELDGEDRLPALVRLPAPAEAAGMPVRARRSGSGGRG